MKSVLACWERYRFFESIAYWHFGPSVYEIDQVRDDRETGRNSASTLRYLPLLLIIDIGVEYLSSDLNMLPQWVLSECAL